MMQQNELSKEPLTKEQIESCRHKSEKRWYRFMVFLNMILIIGVIVACVIHIPQYKKTVEQKMKGNQEKFIEEVTNELFSENYMEGKVPTELKLFVTGMFILFLIPFILYFYYAKLRINGVRITEKNFPEVHQRIEEYSWKLGLKEVPQAYVVQQSGVLNAFSSFVVKKQYIQINSELFEIAYREHKDMDALDFIIGHELSHIRYAHATFHYNLPIWFVMGIPIIGTTASRAREYSCDRLSQLLTGSRGIDAMFALIVDRHLYKSVDLDAYLEDAAQEKGFFVWLNNLLSTHPVMTKRIKALVDRYGSGKLY